MAHDDMIDAMVLRVVDYLLRRMADHDGKHRRNANLGGALTKLLERLLVVFL